MTLSKFIKLTAIALVTLFSGAPIFSRAAPSSSDCEAPRPLSCPNFELVYGEATTATVNWLLLEEHDQVQDRAQCIEILSRDHESHTLYLEEAQEPVNCDLVPFLQNKPGRVCKSWDDSAASRALSNVPSIQQAEEAGQNLEILHWIQGAYEKEIKASKISQVKAKKTFERDLNEMIRILMTQDFSTGKFKTLEEAQPKVVTRCIDNIKKVLKFSKAETPADAFQAAMKADENAATVSRVTVEDHQEILRLNALRDKRLISLFKQRGKKNHLRIFAAGAFHGLEQKEDGSLKGNGILRAELKAIVDKNPKRTAVLKHKSVR